MADLFPGTQAEVMELTRDRHCERIEQTLHTIGDLLRRRGFAADEIEEWPDCEWRFTALPPGVQRPEDGGVDVSFRIIEALDFGDDEVHDGYGVNFGITVTLWGGPVLADIQPFNHTEKCWVDARDAAATEQRFHLVVGDEVGETAAEYVTRRITERGR